MNGLIVSINAYTKLNFVQAKLMNGLIVSTNAYIKLNFVQAKLIFTPDYQSERVVKCLRSQHKHFSIP